MKTLRLIPIAMIALLSINSCTVEEYYPSEVYEESWHVEKLEVKRDHWQLVGEEDQIGTYFEYIFDEIPLDVSYDKGIVTAYIYLDYGTPNEVQTPLPYTEYKVGYDENGKEVYYSIQYTYDVKADNTIAFKVYVSDYLTSTFPGPEDGSKVFKVAIIW